MPPLFRRCPNCGCVGRSRRFAAVDGRELVECPACGHRFEPFDNPLLN